MKFISRENFIRACDRIIEWCLCLILFVVTFSTSLVEICAITAITFWCVRKFFNKDLTVVKNKADWILLIFWFWIVFSYTNTEYTMESFRGILKVGEYALVFAISSIYLVKDVAIKRGVFVMMFGALVSSLNGFYQYLTGEDFIRHKALIHKDYMHRISSSFVHPNDFGIYLVVVTVILLSLLFFKRDHLKGKFFYYLSIFALSIFSLFLTKSRGAWLAFAISFIILGALKSKKMFLRSIMLAFFVAIVLFFTTPERILDLVDLKGGGTTWERLTLWKGTVNMIKVHPVLGFGINTYSRNFPKYRPEGYPDVRYAHNSYLQMASEIGIVGAFIFIVFLIVVLAYSLKGILRMPDGIRKAFASGLFASLIGFSLNSAVDTHLHSVSLAVFFHLLLGWCFALTFYAK